MQSKYFKWITELFLVQVYTDLSTVCFLIATRHTVSSIDNFPQRVLDCLDVLIRN